MAITDAGHRAWVQTELDSVFFQKFNENVEVEGHATALTEDLFKPVTMTNSAFIEDIYAGPGLFQPVSELGVVPEDYIAGGDKTSTYAVTWADSLVISKAWFDDQMHGVWQKAVSDFASMARVTQDINAFAVYRNAFSTSFPIHDGVALISAAHVLVGTGTTASNLVTGALDVQPLKNAVTSLMQQVNQRGIPMGNTPAFLLVPTALYPKAIEVTQSALIANSGQNNLNVFRVTSGYGLKVYTSIRLDNLPTNLNGSDSAWFVLANNHGISRAVRQGMVTALVNWEYSNNISYKYQANYREVVWARDWVGIVGSTGL